MFCGRLFFFLPYVVFVLFDFMPSHMALARAAGEMLHVAEPFLEQAFHPTVICRGEQLEFANVAFSSVYVVHHAFAVPAIKPCRICPLVLVTAYKMALEDALALLEKCSFAIDVTNRKLVAVADLQGCGQDHLLACCNLHN